LTTRSLVPTNLVQSTVKSSLIAVVAEAAILVTAITGPVTEDTVTTAPFPLTQAGSLAATQLLTAPLNTSPGETCNVRVAMEVKVIEEPEESFNTNEAVSPQAKRCPSAAGVSQ
jgi:hypothetical protein